MSVESQLTALPCPEAPADLAANVMARIARIDDGRDAVPAARPTAILAAWPSWALALGVVLIAAALLGSITAGHRTVTGLLASIFIPSNRPPGVMPAEVTFAFVAGLALYVLGLFGHGAEQSGGRRQ